MEQLYSNTIKKKRKRGKHLRLEDRGAIKVLKELGYSNRSIAKIINCSPTTIGNELKRGTKEYKGRGRKPIYSAKRGQETYNNNRKRCHRKNTKIDPNYISWMATMITQKDWSIDTCTGYAIKKELFKKERIPCTKTVYNKLWRGELPINVFNCSEILSRKPRRLKRNAKRLKGDSIDLRPKEVDLRNTFGHWEIDTVVGKKTTGEAAILTIVERFTGYYISIKIEEHSSYGVECGIRKLQEEFKEKFNEIFKTITSDNGPEFSTLSQMDLGKTKVYFAHPYSSFERPVNERTNRQLRKYIPKGQSINKYSEEQVRLYSDIINEKPRKRLGYRTPEELFNKVLDRIYRKVA